ncbi:TRAP transporter permease [Thalassoroseus pseudoceratinae]|uniref:TRAP transporter permease n=1 Tax=Thalassoroseus pseudoceratinae TaxID=2713176 RepID=UPI001422C2C1|nr:TRAP transporter fused permease subunit [Thalassoroseus pseudoceratinae]
MKVPLVFDRLRHGLVITLSAMLCLFTLYTVNFWQNIFDQFESPLAIFVGIGLVLCFLTYPTSKKLKDTKIDWGINIVCMLASVVCCGFVVIQTESMFESFWLDGQELGRRAGAFTQTDFIIGIVGLLIVLEATRRAIGWIVPMLAILFMVHSYYCHLSQSTSLAQLPSWMLPHAGQDLKELATTAFLSSGVFGKAAEVMYKYVFLFVVFGAFLEMSGATQFIIDFAEKIFGRSPGGPAKVSVLGSGLMGSLSGSAVANAVTTGAFTIPMMRSAGFSPTIAGGINAAAASGGALVPPVMGAGAYMMLELVEPQPTFTQIATAAAIPAVLYYLSIYLIVHFYSKKLGVQPASSEDAKRRLNGFEASVFFGALGILIYLLIADFSPFRAVTGSLVFILVASLFRKELPIGLPPRLLAGAAFVGATLYYRFQFAETVEDPNFDQLLGVWLESSILGSFGLLIFGLIHPAWRPQILDAFTKSAKNGTSLVAASACVGIIIAVVQTTGIATAFSSEIKSVVESSLFLALVGIMVCSIVLGMGVPSVVCYLLMATLMGALLKEMGVIPLAAHLFIFYFGMMSMVTPPVALAAYASATIAKAEIMPTSFAAFKFSLVGFTLPFMFVYRPELLLMSNKPEVKFVSVATADGSPDEAELVGELTRFGEPMQNGRVELSTDESTEPTILETDYFGVFRIPAKSGDQWAIDFVNENENRRRLGIVEYQPDRTVPDADGQPTTKLREDPYSSDARVVYNDQRLVLWDVFIQVLAACIGITALAAGITGFLFTNIQPIVRVGMLLAAALLLTPEVRIGGQEIGLYTNLSGTLLFVVTGAINFLRSRNSQPEPSET